MNGIKVKNATYTTKIEQAMKKQQWTLEMLDQIAKKAKLVFGEGPYYIQLPNSFPSKLRHHLKRRGFKIVSLNKIPKSQIIK